MNTLTWSYRSIDTKHRPYKPDFYDMLLKSKVHWPGGKMGGDDQGLKLTYVEATGLPYTLQRFRKAIFVIFNKEFAQYHGRKPSNGMPGFNKMHLVDLKTLRKELEAHCSPL